MNDRTPLPLYDASTLQTVTNWLLALQGMGNSSELDTFPKMVLDSLKPIIPHQASFWGGGRPPASAPILHYCYLHDICPSSLALFEKHKNETSSCTSFLTNNPGRAFTFSAGHSPIDPMLTLVFMPVGIHDILTIYLFDSQLCLYHAISLYRTDGVPFTEAERGIFQSVAPHMINALRTCQIAHIKHLNESPLISLASKAIVDTEGVLHFAEDRLLALLGSEWQDWQGPWLPLDIRTKLNVRSGAPHRIYTGKHIVLSVEGDQTLRLLCARPRLDIDGLTGRELEVAKLFASGMSNKQIAARLDVSPSTIRNQLTTAYEKLGVGDKGALAAYLSQF
jgi:DNA-binding CsgD family transcriptional regulator